MSRQTLRSYKSIELAVPSATSEFVRDYSAIKDELTAAQNAIENLKPLFGAQTPEGNVTSNNSMTYFDTTNSPTNVDMYFNSVVGSDTGWVIVT